jgi:hypothetical protein
MWIALILTNVMSAIHNLPATPTQFVPTRSEVTIASVKLVINRMVSVVAKLAQLDRTKLPTAIMHALFALQEQAETAQLVLIRRQLLVLFAQLVLCNRMMVKQRVRAVLLKVQQPPAQQLRITMLYPIAHAGRDTRIRTPLQKNYFVSTLMNVCRGRTIVVPIPFATTTTPISMEISSSLARAKQDISLLLAMERIAPVALKVATKIWKVIWLAPNVLPEQFPVSEAQQSALTATLEGTLRSPDLPFALSVVPASLERLLVQQTKPQDVPRVLETRSTKTLAQLLAKLARLSPR